MASRSWNRVELIGNLTRDTELRYTPNGAAVCTFGLATNRTYVADGEKKEEVDFHRIVAWNKLGELCNQLLKKGDKVFLSGRLQSRSWEAADGTTKQTVEIVVEDMILLNSRSGAAEGPITEEIASSPVAPRNDEAAVKQEEPKVEEAPVVEDKPADTQPKAAKEEVEDDLPF